MNKIVIELCAEDRARIDHLTEALCGLGLAVDNNSVITAKGQATTTPKAEPAQAAAADDGFVAIPDGAADEVPFTPEPAAPVEAPAEPAPKAEPAPEVSAAELQSKVVNLVRSGKKDEARAIVMEYAENVSAIPAEKRAEVLERLNALEG